MGRKSLFGRSKSLALAAVFAAALFASCDFGFNDDSFQNKAGAYFKEMTSTAAVVSYNVTKGSALTDKYGNLCFGYDEDHVVTLSLRNPQHYTFKYGTNMFMTLAGNTGKTPLDLASLVKIEQNSSDTTKLVITFPQDFLNANPLGADISPTVTLMHPVSFAQFTPYNGLKLSSNSPPPTPAGAVAMQTTETPSRWVVCFNFPNAGVVKKYHSDLQSMTIEGQSVSISVNDGAISYQGSSAISSAPPATIVANQNTGVSFKASGQPVYFATGDEADEKEKYYEVKITDNAGLSTEYKVSTRGFKLSSPKAYLTDDTSYASPFSEDGGKNYISQEDDGSSFITIRAEAKTAQVSYTGKDGSTKVVEQTDYDPSDAKMFWEVYLDAACTQLVNSGIIKGLVGKIAVPAGTSYVRSYVQKPLYSDSETVTWFCRAVSTKFYISETGDNTANTGSRSSPYRTIQFAVDKFADGMIQGDYEADCKCRIILLDNLTVPSDFNFDANDGYLIKIPTAVSTASVSVEGDGGEKTVTLPGSAGLRRLFLYALSGETELKNIAVTGASGNASAPPIITAAGTALRLASSRISGCNLLCADGETAYLVANYGTLEMDGAAMRDNIASRSGSGTEPTFNLVFNRGTAKISNSEFSGHGGLWNIIDNEGSLEVSGGSIRDNACARSIRNRAGTATLTGLAVQNSANIWNAAALVMEGCSVTGNSSEGLGSGVYLEDTASATLTLKGANTIYDNHSAADPAKQSNVYVPYGKAIEVGGNISGSKVGVYMPFTDSTKPTLTAPVAFTHGYGYGSTNPLKPGNAFCGDNGYGVAVMESGAALGEAAFAVSSGSMYGASDYSFDFAAADEAGNTVTHVYQPNTADVVITVTPTAQRSNATAGTQALWYAHPLLYADSAHAEEATGQNKAVEWTAALYNSGMPALTLSVAGTADGSGIRVTLPVSSFTGEYTLKVRAKFLGLYHDFNLPVSFGVEPPAANPAINLNVSAMTTDELTNFFAGLDATVYTKDNPAKIALTGLPSVEDWGNSDSVVRNAALGKMKAVADAIRSSGAYLDLSETQLPNGTPLYSDLYDTRGDTGSYSAPQKERGLFYNCAKLVKPPKLPVNQPPSFSISNKECSMIYTFCGCTSLTEIPEIPLWVPVVTGAFKGCTSLEDLSSVTIPRPNLPDGSWIELKDLFEGCTGLKYPPAIGDGVTKMDGTFRNCTSLLTVPAIPSSVSVMTHTFESCTSLTDLSSMVIPSGPAGIDLTSTFKGCTSLTAAPAIPDGAMRLDNCFEGCKKLTRAPVIPTSVSDLSGCFASCTNLGGNVVIKSSLVTSSSQLDKAFGVSDDSSLATAKPSGMTVYVPAAGADGNGIVNAVINAEENNHLSAGTYGTGGANKVIAVDTAAGDTWPEP